MTVSHFKWPAIALALAFAVNPGGTAAAQSDDATLTFLRGSTPVVELTRAELIAKVPPTTASFFDPRYEKTKTYRCLAISGVMAAVFGERWASSEFTEAEFTALDRYVSVAPARKLNEPGGCLAVGDVDAPGWEPVGRKGVSPGPFYLAWSGPNQSTENDYPWPYQLKSIALIRFEDRYPEVVPQGAAAGSPAMRGYDLFKAHCVRCHAINQQGGKIGPDLNAPRSIVSYRPRKMIKAYIRKPSDFRYTEMPDQPFLTDAGLEDIYQYFVFKSKQPASRQAK